MTLGGRVQALTGVWRLATDPENVGKAERWFDSARPDAQAAPVPGVIQQVFPGYHGVAWYWHSFRSECRYGPGESLRIMFGAVDYLAEVWVNGTYVGSFEGGETPFDFDITELIKDDSNLLALRVLNPTYDFIDGYTLSQVPHLNKVMVPQAGCSYNFGGIMYPVELHVVPAVYITDLFVQATVLTGTITAVATLHNNTGDPSEGVITYTVAGAGATGDVVDSAEHTVTCTAGVSQHDVTLTLTHPRLWNLDDPFLYRVTAEVRIPGQRPDQKSVRCGFRDFRVTAGYFHLNGRRLFLKSSHTGNHVPIGMKVPVVPDHVRRDVIHAKAAGFNTIRSMGALWPEQLDFCDEIGMLVIEESLAGWLLGAPNSGYSYARQYPELPTPVNLLEERFDHNNVEMIRRDRNHPSVVAWELLNETQDGPIFENAVRFLPTLRALDPTRLVLLSSGRFDGRYTIGSVSNPGSDTWDYAWGVEGPDAPPGTMTYPSPAGSGEFHFYPGVPQTAETNAFLRNLGKHTKPVFVSEYGIGSLFDVINEWRHFEQAGARPDLEDMSWLREQSEKLSADWKRLGLENAYPFVEDMLRDSQRLNARQRTLGFSLIRSNPRLCGFSLTGLLDHGMCGEGLWTLWREWKPEMFDAVRDGWSSLRWCLFAEPMHAYAGREVTIEAVLATEDVLQPGEYPAHFRVFGPTGAVWEKSATVTIPDPLQLAVPVIRETFRLDGPGGQYTFTANLERGGAPTGAVLTFHVSNAAEWPRLSGNAALWGIDQPTAEWLTARGLDCHDFTADEATGVGLILVGQPPDFDDENLYDRLKQRMIEGATVLFLSAQLFKNNARAIDWLPLEHKGSCATVQDMLYHKECVANRHAVFAGLQGPGVLDMDYYGQVIPHEVFRDQDTPDVTICAGFNTGYIFIPGGYGSNLLIALYNSGNGRFILSTPYVLENLDAHPAADRLLINLVSFAQQR